MKQALAEKSLSKTRSGLGCDAGFWQAKEGGLLRRLFSTFAPGWPGAGLLILRLVACSAMVVHRYPEWKGAQSVQFATLPTSAILASALLAVGLWTPVSGCLVAAVALWHLFTKSGEPTSCILLASIGLTLAMVGPGVWSLDARLFGWRRISIPDR
jgi:putative oxidoreductase